jgi:peptidoglycan biosynthesis protein MviN/MurJ (putative lipid II flippase)
VISGPISVATAGYLYSEQGVRTPLVATVINAAVWIGLAAILLPSLGIAAVGIAWMGAAWTEAAVFSRALHRAGIAVGRMIVVPVVAAVASALLAYAAQTPLATSLVPGIATAAVALGAYLALSYVFNRPDLLATARRVRSLT